MSKLTIIIPVVLVALGIVTGALSLMTGEPEPFVAWLFIAAFAVVTVGLYLLTSLARDLHERRQDYERGFADGYTRAIRDFADRPEEGK